jgi:hypothetical protein
MPTSGLLWRSIGTVVEKTLVHATFLVDGFIAGMMRGQPVA